MTLLNNLPHKCTIARRERAVASGGDGIPLETTVAVSTNVECWAQQMSASESHEYQKRGMAVNRKVFFADDPGVDAGMTITMTEQNGTGISEANQQVFDVISSPDPDASASLGIVWRVDCNASSSARFNQNEI
jgi:hypothetical protein